MRTGGTSRVAHQRNLLSPAYLLVLLHLDVAQMRIIGVDSAAVVNKDGVAVTPKLLSAPRKNDAAVRAGYNGSSHRSCDVQSFVKTTPSVTEWGGENATRYRKFKLRYNRISLSQYGG